MAQPLPQLPLPLPLVHHPHVATRFYNAQLRGGVYDRCALPTLEPFPAAPNAIPPNGYAVRTQHAEGATEFQHTRCIPLRAPPPIPHLSRAFLDFKMPAPPPPAEEDAGGGDGGGGGGGCGCSGGANGTDVAAAAALPTTGKRKRTPPPQQKKKKKATTNGQKRREGGDVVFRSYRLRMLPTPAQRTLLLRYMEVCAHTYNWANAMAKRPGARISHYSLRKLFTRSQRGRLIHLDDMPPPVDIHVQAGDGGAILDDVPFIIRSYAIKECAEAHNHPKNHGHPDRIGDRRMDLRDEKPTATFTLEKHNSASSGLVSFSGARAAHRHKVDVVDGRYGRHPRRARGRGDHALMECGMQLNGAFKALGPICVQDKARIIRLLVADGGRLKENAKVLWDKRTGAFHLSFLQALPKLADPDPAFDHKRIVATDPGCRPFQAWYSPTTGQHGVVLAGMEDRIRARRHALDVQERRVARRKHEDRHLPDAPTSRARRLRLQTAVLRAKARAHTTRRMCKRLARERVRFANWIEAAHYDAANFLLRDHDLIIQPRLNTRRLIEEAPAPAIAQRYRDWAHHKFRQRLQSASARYAGRHVLITTEPGTSRTCTHCGFWNQALAVTDGVFRCPHCALCVDRQVAGARNNFFAAYGMAIGVGWDGVVVGGVGGG